LMPALNNPSLVVLDNAIFWTCVCQFIKV
jgi:hypothetical protein